MSILQSDLPHHHPGGALGACWFGAGPSSQAVSRPAAGLTHVLDPRIVEDERAEVAR